ncbi:MAG: hypothetical protein MUO23_14090, partial [Anaerolineales bacterium]|nr:hypothetical protein [Anaerolineales bacterium]
MSKRGPPTWPLSGRVIRQPSSKLSQAYGDRLYWLALGLLGDPQAPEAAGLALAERGLRLAVAGG